MTEQMKLENFDTFEALVREAMPYIERSEAVPDALQEKIYEVFETNAVNRKYLIESSYTAMMRQYKEDTGKDYPEQVLPGTAGMMRRMEIWDEQNRYWYDLKPEWQAAVEELMRSCGWNPYRFVGIKITRVGDQLKGEAPDPDDCYGFAANFHQQGAIFFIRMPEYPSEEELKTGSGKVFTRPKPQEEADPNQGKLDL